MKSVFISSAVLILCSLSFSADWIIPSFEEFEADYAVDNAGSNAWNLSADWLMWNEKGYSFLSDVERRQAGLGAGISLPFGAGLDFDVSWLEEHFDGPGGYDADLCGISGFLPLPSISSELSAGMRTKDYRQREAQDSESFFLQIRWDLSGRASLYGSFARTDQIYNYYGLFQGARADTYTLAIAGTNVVQYEVRGDLIEYRDGNEALRIRISAGKGFQAGPGVCIPRLGAEYRDARYRSYYLVMGDNVAGIIFPYWAPRNYTACSAGLEYALGFSGDSGFSAGADILYDTEKDAGLNAGIKWRYKWFFLRGNLFRSDEWDSEGLSAGIQF